MTLHYAYNDLQVRFDGILAIRVNGTCATDVTPGWRAREDSKLLQCTGRWVGDDMSVLDDATPSAITLNYHREHNPHDSKQISCCKVRNDNKYTALRPLTQLIASITGQRSWHMKNTPPDWTSSGLTGTKGLLEGCSFRGYRIDLASPCHALPRLAGILKTEFQSAKTLNYKQLLMSLQRILNIVWKVHHNVVKIPLQVEGTEFH